MNPELNSNTSPAYTSCEEMFEANNKKHYLKWSIIFIVLLAVSILLYLSSLITFVVQLEVIKTTIFQEAVKNNNFNQAQFDANWKSFILKTASIFSIIVLAYLTMFIWFIVDIIKIQKAKNYAKSSRFMAFFMNILFFIPVLMSFFNLLWNPITFFESFKWTHNILNILGTLVFVVGYLVGFVLFKRIVAQFRRLEYELAMNKSGINDIFNTFFGGGQMNNNSETNTSAEPKSEDEPVVMAANQEDLKNSDEINYVEKLKVLSDEKLVEMAKRLNIYGAEDLKREELISKIAASFAKTEEANVISKQNEKADQNQEDKE
ncbi:hypothetical protein [[Mycoplasma] anseris]|uniref:Rho termination factor N-terminal domain-containing protein n=1 Tax=[Mycoplasma] anseris TaxID=92400 RepID=A0A2Z4NEG0_9BACT|nr:hypothetical protein [[Mycoplasma] anseris]AWX69735.1 hypothetical protein DP065_03280 [[Mycoplasma] anseris]